MTLAIGAACLLAGIIIGGIAGFAIGYHYKRDDLRWTFERALVAYTMDAETRGK